jgi:hypothetical protein
MNRILIGRIFSLAVVLSLGLAATPTRADILADLIASGGSLTVGDKVFSNFGYTGNTGNFPDPTGITVNPIPPSGTDAQGNFGIRFGLGAFSPPGVTTDFLITYTVTSLGAGIIDVHLDSNLAITGTPGPQDHPFGSIVETIATEPGPGGLHLAQISNGVTPTTSSLHATAGFVPPGPYQSLFVTKDVLLFSTGVPGTAEQDAITNVSFIDQSFSQVPEPGSLMLLGLSGLGLVGLAWRRR